MLAIVAFDQHCLTCQIEDFRIGQALHGLYLARYVLPFCPSGIHALSVNKFHLLCPDPPPQNSASPEPHCWFMHKELVRVGDTLNNRLAQTPNATDQDDVTAATFGVERKNDPGTRTVGSYHSLHPYRQRNAMMGKALIYAVRDRAFAEQRCKAIFDRTDQSLCASHIKVTFVYASK